MVRGRADGVSRATVGAAHRRHTRRSCSLSAEGQLRADLRVARMSALHARGWVLALLLAGWNASPVEGQAQRTPPDTKRRAAPNLTCVVTKLADGDSFTCADGRKVRLLLI